MFVDVCDISIKNIFGGISACTCILVMWENTKVREAIVLCIPMRVGTIRVHW